MPERYDFNGVRLAKSGLHPAMDNLGVIEFDLSRILPQLPLATESLILGLLGHNLPEQRSWTKETVPYFNASINYAGKVQPIGNLTVEYQDYLNGLQRATLDAWSNLVYDEMTGLGHLKPQYVCNGLSKLMGPDGNVYSSYKLYNVFPLKRPPLPNQQFSRGQLVIMTVDFAVDFMVPVIQNGVPVNQGGLGTVGARDAFAAATVAAGINIPIAAI